MFSPRRFDASGRFRLPRPGRGGAQRRGLLRSSRELSCLADACRPRWLARRRFDVARFRRTWAPPPQTGQPTWRRRPAFCRSPFVLRTSRSRSSVACGQLLFLASSAGPKLPMLQLVQRTPDFCVCLCAVRRARALRFLQLTPSLSACVCDWRREQRVMALATEWASRFEQRPKEKRSFPVSSLKHVKVGITADPAGPALDARPSGCVALQVR